MPVKTQPKIEFLFWSDCPSHPEARRLLDEVLAEMDLAVAVKEIEVTTDAIAEDYAFPGSPTILVDGQDVDPVGASHTGTALTCRVYLLEDERYSPVPSKEMIRRALA
ncbi:DUF2703 domain-containing protein [Chloroflexota bacterium]